MEGSIEGLAHERPGLLERIRASINHPSLMGEQGARVRFARIQWSMVVWRFITLAQIPILIAVSPERFVSISYAWIYFSVVLVYTMAYSWLATGPAAGNRHLYIADMLICCALLLTAREATLVYAITFYTYTCLMNRPVLLKRETVPQVVGLSLVFLVASSTTVNPFYSTSLKVGEFLVFYFWGLAILVFSSMLAKASALELEGYLEDQRRGYRRRLHDDLGNTLCGLHYKIQSLRRSSGDDLNQALAFLAHGYKRASSVLVHLVDELDEIVEEDLCDALKRSAQRAREEFGLKVDLTAPEGRAKISPAVRREILWIVREALANSAKHSGTGKARVSVSRKRGRLTVTIADDGSGFDTCGLRQKQEFGSMGVKGMQERAAMIHGDLQLVSAPWSGTSVTLSIEEQQASRLAGRLARLRSRHPDRIYSFLAYLKMIIALLVLLEIALMDPALRGQPTVWLVAFAVLADGVACVLFPARLYRLLNRLPWLLAVEQAIFCLLIFAAWRAGLPLFFDSAPTMALAFNACILTMTGNLAVASLAGLGMMIANLLAPATASMHGQRMEELVINIISNLLIAMLAGLAVEFVRNLEGLQQLSIDRALAKQREQLTAETHRQLYSRVQAVGGDIRRLAQRIDGPDEGFAQGIGGLEARSTELKSELKQIMRSLELPAKKP